MTDVQRDTAAGALAEVPPGRAGTLLARYWILLLVPVVGVVGWFASQPVTITLIFASVWATYAIGYDLFSGYSGRVNLGYAMFPGTGAYTAAVLSTRLGLSPWLGLVCGIGAAMLLALVLGVLTLRIKGIYFALATAIVPLALFQLTHVLGRFFGGEEGIWGVPNLFLDTRYNLVVILVILALCLAFSLWLVNSKVGLVLRAIQGSDLTTQALGLSPFRFLLVAFLASAAIGGAGGAFLAYFQMFIGPEVLFIITTLQVITFAIVGGPATIVGPVLGSFVLVILNEYLRAWSDYRLFAYFVVLVLLLRFAPDGLIMPAVRAVRRLVAGRLAGRAAADTGSDTGSDTEARP